MKAYRFPGVFWALEIPHTVDRTMWGIPREKRGKKNYFPAPLRGPILHLQGYYTAIRGNCKLYFVKYILSMSNMPFSFCALYIVVNIL